MESNYYCTEIEGQDVSDLLNDIKIEESDTQANLATLNFIDSELILHDVLREGLNIEIDLGRVEAHSRMFRGVITSVRPKIPSQGQPELEVEALNSLVKLALQPKTRKWGNLRLNEIVEQIARDNGLRSGEVPTGAGEDNPSIPEMRPLQQIEETDLAFLFRLAQDYGCRLYINHEDTGDSLNFVSIQSLLQAEALNTPLVFNDNLEEFSITADSFAATPEQILISTDPTTGELVPSPTDEPDTRFEEEEPPNPDRTALSFRIARLTAITTSRQATTASFRRMPARVVGAPARDGTDQSRTFGDPTHTLGQSAEGRTTGSIWLQPRRRVRIEGYGGRWSGPWYLTEVEHHLNVTQRQYTTSFTCTR